MKNKIDIRKDNSFKKKIENAMYRAFNSDKEEFVEILVHFWDNQKNAITYKEIRNALLNGDISYNDIEKWHQDYSKLINTKLKPRLESINREKCEGVKKEKNKYEYNSHDYELNKWIESKCAGLITNLTDEQRNAVAALIRRANDNRMSGDEASKIIRPCIGLTKPQAEANMKYYENVKKSLIKNNPDISISSAESRARESALKYAEKQHRYRADTIAQTEFVSANNQAYLASIKDAYNKGVIGYGRFVWSCTFDENSCVECMDLDGTSVDIGQSFPIKGAEYFEGQHQAPPLHPRCGCSIYFEETESPAMDEYFETNYKENENLYFNSDENSGIINYARASDAFIYNDDDIPINAEIKPQDIIDNLVTSPIGRETLEYIEKNKIYPQLNYEPQYLSQRGQQCGDVIEIFIDNIPNVRVAAQTVIHEITHHRYNIGGCQWAEAVCLANEKKHIVGRNHLTPDELIYIVNLARNNYTEYNWKKGGYKNGKKF